tara:strand:- start:209 stop:841 length:633 start_codon:yes stop_codon:yes gene_type:complete
MPLTAKGKKLKSKFREQYGKEKGDSVFYAMENSGKLKKVVKAKGGKDFGASPDKGSVDRSAVGQGSQYRSNVNRKAISDMRKGLRQTISPSTTPTNRIAALAAGLVIPGGSYIYRSMIDQNSLFAPKPKRNVSPKPDRDNIQNRVQTPKILPIEATKPIDTTLVKPKDNFFNFKAFNVGGLSGGVSYGPPPKKGPNPQVPPVKFKKGGQK